MLLNLQKTWESKRKGEKISASNLLLFLEKDYWLNSSSKIGTIDGFVLSDKTRGFVRQNVVFYRTKGNDGVR